MFSSGRVTLKFVQDLVVAICIILGKVLLMIWIYFPGPVWNHLGMMQFKSDLGIIESM